MKKLYKTSEALEVLGIGRTRAYQEMADGRLKYIQYGGTRMFTEQHLDDFVARLSADEESTP